MADPRTPSPSRNASSAFPNLKALVDSPFSDYYSDIADSAAASPAQKQLVQRINGVRSELLRRTLSDDASRALSAELDALEITIGAPEVQSREPVEIGDSGFMDDDEDDENIGRVGAPGFMERLKMMPRPTGSTTEEDFDDDSEDEVDEVGAQELMQSRNGMGIRMSDSPDSVSLQSRETDLVDAYANKIVLEPEEAQKLVARVTDAAGALRARLDELRAINDKVTAELETSNDNVLRLRSENEALRQDVRHSHTELLFMKLQLKAVEVSARESSEGDKERGYKSSVCEPLTEGIERWKRDWVELDRKFQATRAKHGMEQPKSGLVDEQMIEGANDDDDAQSKKPSRSRVPAQLVRRIIKISRPGAGSRSFTAPVEPLTPSDTTAGDAVRDLDLASVGDHALDTDAITTSEDEDDYSDDEELDGEFGDEQADSEESDVPQKTPWEELWDSLMEYTGMDRLDAYEAS
jgi:hypothetical protein